MRIKRGPIRKEDMPKRPSGAAGAMLAPKDNESKVAHSEKLTRMLTAHRTAALQAAMADRPDVALAQKHQYWKDRVAAREAGQDLFTWLLEQPQSELLDLLALCVSYSIDTVSGRENIPSQPVAGLMIES